MTSQGLSEVTGEVTLPSPPHSSPRQVQRCSCTAGFPVPPGPPAPGATASPRGCSTRSTPEPDMGTGAGAMGVAQGDRDPLAASLCPPGPEPGPGLLHPVINLRLRVLKKAPASNQQKPDFILSDSTTKFLGENHSAPHWGLQEQQGNKTTTKPNKISQSNQK